MTGTQQRPAHHRVALTRAAGVGLLFVGLAFIFFFPLLQKPQQLLWPASGLGSDVAYINWPVQTYYRDQLRATGAFPLWDSRFMLGRPLAGDPHVLWLYPLNALLLILPTVAALNVFMIAHVVVAGAGMFALLRRGFHTSGAAALIGALAFMFMPKFMAQSMGGVLAFGLAWVPLVWLGVRVAVKEGNVFAGAVGGAALALLTPTHIQITYYAAVTAACYAGWLLIAATRARRRQGQPWIPYRAMGATAAFAISFALLAAPIWLSLVELLPYTSRQSFTVAEASFYQLPAALLATLFAPSQFQFPEWTMYLGVAPMMLALAATIGPRRRETIFFGVLVLFALVYALGNQTPLFGLVFRLVPGASFLRVPTRLWALAGAAAALLAGLGVDALGTPALRRWTDKHARALTLLTAAYVVALAAALCVVGLMARQWQGQIAVVGLVVVGMAGLARAFSRGQLSRPALLVGVCLAVGVDLMPLARTFFTLEDPATSFMRPSAALDFIAAQPGLFRTYATHRELGYAATAAAWLETMDGALSFQLAHAVAIIKAASGCELDGFATGVPPCLTSEIDPEAYRTAQPKGALLGLLNVKYVVSSFALTDPALRPVLTDGALTVYENDAWLPRAFVVSRVEAQPDEAAALTATRQGTPERVAYVAAASAPWVGQAETPPRPAEIVERAAGYYRLQAEGEGWLVFSETWAPGWTARVNGETAPLYRTDGALLGLYVPPGPQSIELVYAPLGRRIGFPLLLLGLSILAVWGAGKIWRRAKPAPESV